MSDFARLEEKLAKLRQRERAPGEARKLKGSDADALLAAIVMEIDETILPRRLSFALDANTAIHVSVANRRLQALLSPAPKGIDSALADQELPDADDPKVAALGVGLRAVLGDVESLTVSAERPKTLFASDIGVPTSQLAPAWGISTEAAAPAVPSEVLGAYLSSITNEANAWLRIEGEAVIDQGGAPEAVAELVEAAALFLDGYFSKFDTAFPEPSESCGTIISPGSNQSTALFFIEYGELSALIAAKPESVFALATRWQKLIAE